MKRVIARELSRWLLAIVCVVSLAGLAAELVGHEVLVSYLSLSYEGNVPTWVATTLLFASALTAASIARDALAFRRHWWGVAAVFAYASLDETAQLHEHLGGLVSAGGVLYFDWIIPATVLLLGMALIFWPFVRALAPPTRRRLIVAGAIYLGGAVAMELPLGWWTDRAGSDTMGYALIDWVEETLELAGASLALLALVRHREETA